MMANPACTLSTLYTVHGWHADPRDNDASCIGMRHHTSRIARVIEGASDHMQKYRPCNMSLASMHDSLVVLELLQQIQVCILQDELPRDLPYLLLSAACI